MRRIGLLVAALSFLWVGQAFAQEAEINGDMLVTGDLEILGSLLADIPSRVHHIGTLDETVDGDQFQAGDMIVSQTCKNSMGSTLSSRGCVSVLTPGSSGALFFANTIYVNVTDQVVYAQLRLFDL